MTKHSQCENLFAEFDIHEARRVMIVLGPMPRATLNALVDYGMSDAEISRYFRLPTDTVSALIQYYVRQAATLHQPRL